MQHGKVQGEQLLEDEDDLGYYPDGAKRTLTNEQIAMFRHSEIYAIVRQRQLHNENREVEPEDQAPAFILEARGPTRTEEVQQPGLVKDFIDVAEATSPKTTATQELANSDDEEEYVRFLEAEEEEMKTEAARKKRKRNRRYPGASHDRAPTHRRLVRELDEAVIDDGPLDYGEEPAVSTGPIPTENLQQLLGRKPIVYENKHSEPINEAPNTSHPEPPAPKQGRKIWWPKIGT